MFNLKIEAMTNDNFSQIYAKNYTDTVNYISWKLNGDVTTAQDIAQEVFIKVFRYLNTFDEAKSKLATWLRNITNNCIIDYVRTNQYGKNCVNVTEFDDEETGLSFQFVDTDASTDRMVESKELKAKISRAFAKLNETEQVVAELYFMEEKKYKEIEEETKLKEGTIKSIISRVRVKLQNELAQCSN